MNSELLKQSREVKETADALLAETQLPQMLARYGTVQFTGSFYADLMLAPDIDLHVAIPQLGKELAIEIMNVLIRHNAFKSYQFYDYIARPYEGSPRGYYLGLKLNKGPVEWKVDCWLVDHTIVAESERFRDQQVLMEKLKDVDAAAREHILELKDQKNKVGRPSIPATSGVCGRHRATILAECVPPDARIGAIHPRGSEPRGILASSNKLGLTSLEIYEQVLASKL